MIGEKLPSKEFTDDEEVSTNTTLPENIYYNTVEEALEMIREKLLLIEEKIPKDTTWSLKAVTMAIHYNYATLKNPT